MTISIKILTKIIQKLIPIIYNIKNKNGRGICHKTVFAWLRARLPWT